MGKEAVMAGAASENGLKLFSEFDFLAPEFEELREVKIYLTKTFSSTGFPTNDPLEKTEAVCGDIVGCWNVTAKDCEMCACGGLACCGGGGGG